MSHRLDSASSDGTPSAPCRPGNLTGEGNGEETLSKVARDTCLEGSLAPLDSISGLRAFASLCLTLMSMRGFWCVTPLISIPTVHLGPFALCS